MSLYSGLIRKSTLAAIPLAQEYAEGNMIARVKVTRSQDATFNRATGGRAVGSELVVWDGIGRVYKVQGATQMDLGDEPQYFSSATVSIPIRAPKPHAEDIVTILEHPDPNIVGRSFKVDGVAAGGQIPVTHEMACTGIQASATNPGA